MNQKILAIVLALFLGVIFIWGQGKFSVQASETHNILTSDTVWVNTARDLAPKDLKGRMILLDFWTYGCINCLQVIPDLKYLEKKYGDDLMVIGVHSGKFTNERGVDQIKEFVARYNIRHAVINDADYRIWQGFGISAWPSFVLIDPMGKVVGQWAGEGQRGRLDKAIVNLRDEFKDKLNKDALPLSPLRDAQPMAVLNYPTKMITVPDYEGRPVLFVADTGHHRILGVELQDSDTAKRGEIFMTIGGGEEGTRDGNFWRSQFSYPHGMVYQSGSLYIADTGNHSLRLVNLKDEYVSTLAGTGHRGFNTNPQGADALMTALASPWDLAFYPDQNHLAIAMAGTHQLWSYDIENATLSTLAGNGSEGIIDGLYPDHNMAQPSALYKDGTRLYVLDAESSALRVLEKGNLQTLIGQGLFDFGYKDGAGREAMLQHPVAFAFKDQGVYIADSYNHVLRHYDLQSKEVTTIFGQAEKAGDDLSSWQEAMMNEPSGMTFLPNGHLLVADTNNHRLLELDLAQQKIMPFDIFPKMEKEEIPYMTSVPNAWSQDPIFIKPDGKVDASLAFEEGWKMNDQAPSYLALYEITVMLNGFVPELKKVWMKDDLAKPFLVEDLHDDKLYQLQGILYYCEDKMGSICLIQGVNQVIRESESEAKNLEEDLVIPLGDPRGANEKAPH